MDHLRDRMTGTSHEVLIIKLWNLQKLDENDLTHDEFSQMIKLVDENREMKRRVTTLMKAVINLGNRELIESEHFKKLKRDVAKTVKRT